LRALALCTCCRHYPGAAAGRRRRSSHPALSAFPDNVVGSACTSSFSRSHEVMVATGDLGACPCRARADGSRRNGEANEGRASCAAGGFRGLLEQSAELACGHWLMIAAAGKQPALFRRNAGVMPGRPRLPPLPQQVEDLGRQHHMSVPAAFRLHDADDHLLTVDVARPQSRHLAGPQPAAIGEGQHRARLQARRHGERLSQAANRLQL
jgi:hypothetical protein